MSLPKLKNWDQTAEGLHQAVRLLGAVQRLSQEPQSAYLELGLKMAQRGLSSGWLPSGGRVRLDFWEGQLVYDTPGRQADSFPLNGRTQAAVFNDMFGALAEREPGLLPPEEELFERVSAGIAARQARYKPLQREMFMDETPVMIDLQSSRNYQTALDMVFTGLARCKARLLGLQTPLVVWPHGFDLSTLWFAGTEIDENQPHLNFGFSPRSEGIDHPYLYAYAYPIPENAQPPALPEGARWHTQGWEGIVLPYEVIAEKSNLAGFVEASCIEIYNGFQSWIPGSTRI